VYEGYAQIVWGEDVGAGRSRHAVYVRVADRSYVAERLERVSADEGRLIEQFLNAEPVTTGLSTGFIPRLVRE
jgi:hypothetical protein